MKKIAIHSVPRSGSTWLGAIFDSHPKVEYKLQPLFSFAFKGRLSPISTKDEINLFFEELFVVKDDFMDQVKGKSDKLIPTFSKNNPENIVYKEVRYHHILENLLEKDRNVIVIGLIRNPFAVISSWLNAPKEFRSDLGWKKEEEWRRSPKKNNGRIEEYNGFEKWKEVALLFLRLQKDFPENFYLLEYEKLINTPHSEVEKLFSFCGLEMEDQTRIFLDVSTTRHNENPYSVYKRKMKDDGWKENLSPTIEAEIKNDEDFKNLNKIFNWI